MAADIIVATLPSARLANRLYGDSNPSLGDKIKAAAYAATGVAGGAFAAGLGLATMATVAVAAAPIATAATGLSMLGAAVLLAAGGVKAASSCLSPDFAERTASIPHKVDFFRPRTCKLEM